MRRSPGPLWLLAGVPLLALVGMPAMALLLWSRPDAFFRELRDPDTLAAIGVSLRTTAISLAIVVAFGTPLAFALSRWRSPLAGFVRILVTLPAVFPPAAAGIALLLAFGRNGPVGPLLESWGIALSFTPAAVVMAQVFVSCPFYVLEASAAFAASDESVEESATLEGAAPGTLFRRIVVPQARGHLASGATLAWARSLGEFGATILFAGSLPGATQTMPLAIYLGFEVDLDRAVALSSILLLMAVAVLVAVGGAAAYRGAARGSSRRSS